MISLNFKVCNYEQETEILQEKTSYTLAMYKVLYLKSAPNNNAATLS